MKQRIAQDLIIWAILLYSGYDILLSLGRILDGGIK